MREEVIQRETRAGFIIHAFKTVTNASGTLISAQEHSRANSNALERGIIVSSGFYILFGRDERGLLRKGFSRVFSRSEHSFAYVWLLLLMRLAFLSA